MVVLRGKFPSTNQKHYPGLSSDTSSGMEFLQALLGRYFAGTWWHRELLAFFSRQIIKVDAMGYIFETFERSAEV